LRNVAPLALANVRFGSLADIGAVLIHVRFTPKSGHWALFDHLVSERDQLWWHVKPNRFGCLEIDDQLELRRLYNW
jgi:hypothetical protein